MMKNASLNTDFSTLMRQLVQKIIAMDRAEKLCHDVTLSQAYTIGIIRKKEILTMNELSQEMGLAISTLTRIIDVLVRDEIVCRNHNEQDRRKVNICLTEKGNDLAKKLFNCSEQFWTQILEVIPIEKREDIISSLSTLIDALERAKQSCCQKH